MVAVYSRGKHLSFLLEPAYHQAVYNMSSLIAMVVSLYEPGPIFQFLRPVEEHTDVFADALLQRELAARMLRLVRGYV